MNKLFILTCEHAGNKVPPAYQYLFEGKEEELYTHKAIDFGALRLARQFALKTDLPVYFSAVSRLLVEANRSRESEELFSDFTKDLPEHEKEQILANYYYPHRNQVEHEIRWGIENGKKIIHVAVHTFTPALDGEVRKADVGILFDPKQPLEQEFAEAYKAAVLSLNPDRQVEFNSPYPGTDDGFPTYLRQQFLKQQYGGLELEVNQKFFLAGEEEEWDLLAQELAIALLTLVNSPDEH